MPGVLTLGHYRSTLVAVRSLARAGFTVVAGLARDSFLARSRYVKEVWQHPLLVQEDRFIESLLAFLRGRPDIKYVFPTGDTSTAALADHYERVRGFALPVMPEPRVVQSCMDKSAAYAIAAEAGLAVPKTYVAKDPEELLGRAEELGYPCLVKPNDSLGGFHETKAIICHSAAQVDKPLCQWMFQNQTVLVQQLVCGSRFNCDVAAKNGQILSMFQSQILRTHKADDTGLTVECVSIAPDAILWSRCSQLLEAMNYTGVALIQFLRRRMAEPVFLEINPRLGAFITFAGHCGHDLPLMALQLADCQAGRTEGTVSRPRYSEFGKRLHWLGGDVNGFWDERRRLTWRQKWRWLFHTAAATMRRGVPMTWSMRDPRPTLSLCAEFFDKPLRHRLARLRRISAIAADKFLAPARSVQESRKG